jgi:hypothetical protein
LKTNPKFLAAEMKSFGHYKSGHKFDLGRQTDFDVNGLVKRGSDAPNLIFRPKPKPKPKP